MGRPEKPIDPQDGPVARFAYELRKLRDEAGAPGYRSMARRAGYSAATLSQAAGGERLPTLPVALAYVRACRGDVEEWRHRWEQADAEITAVPRPPEEDGEPPYRGLERFEPGDAELFFGREETTARLEAMARRHRLGAVVGASGSGKSSLLRAGLIPRLRRCGQDADDRPAAVRVLTPGARPMDRADLLAPAEGAGDTWVLVDQFEELFTLCASPEDRADFLERLLAAQEPGNRLRVVLALRADFFGRCTENHALAAALNDATLLLGPMNTEQLRAAIVRPAQARGLNVERDLTAHILDEVTDEPGALPLMSHALLETWRRRRGHILTHDAYDAAGGLHGAIARTAEDAYHQLTPTQATLARRILLRLIAPGDGTEDTHRPTPRTEFTVLDLNTRADTQAVLDRLARARLLTLDDGTVSLAHEKLITAWPRLQGWINEERDRIRLHRQLTHDALAWHKLDRDAGVLYRGTRLAQAEEAFTGTSQEALNPLEFAFLDASVVAGRRHERRTRRTVITLATLLCLALIATLMAYHQRNDAEHQRRLAVSRETAARAAQLSNDHPEAAMILALRGYRQAVTTESRGSLLSAYSRFYANQLTGHTSAVQSTAFSSDGRTLASASFDHSVKLWDVRSHRLLATLLGHTDVVNTVAFSPDGRTLATAGNDSVKLWDVRSHRLLATLTGHTNMVEGVAFSPDGHTLATASADRTVRLWSVRDHRALAVLTGHSDAVLRLAFSPDGRTLASADSGPTTRLWDVSSHKNLAVLADRTGAGRTVAFSPDSRTLATAGNDGSVKLWDARTHVRLATLTGHSRTVQQVAFSPDGRTLASASTDRTVRLWHPRTHKALTTLHVDEFAYAAAFSPDSRILATTGKDSTIRLWNVTSHRPLATLAGRSGTTTARVPFADRDASVTVDHGNMLGWSTPPGRTRPAPIRTNRSFTAVTNTRDGRVLAMGSRDGTVRVWNLNTGRRTTALQKGTGAVTQVALTPDGNTLAVSTADGAIRVWNVASQRTTAVLHGARSLAALQLRPDGRALAFVNSGGTTRLWHLRSGHRATRLPGPRDANMALAFSPDGSTLAVGTNNGLRLLDVAARRIKAILTARQVGQVIGASFSPDGSTLATTSNEDIVRLWNTRTARLHAALSGPTDAESPAYFSPGGHALATFGPPSAARVWSTDAEYVATRVCRLSTEHRWAQLLPDPTVEDLCPA
ncbi:nSTAND1 domain-containing NTPase [Streptomyces sp. BRA346]|uniref:nSTAND1 domain-containing NTPase n=1 Tax=Streptomyces sp. BRA346 TaxID=2878199 RepID=UPI0040627C0A